MNCPFCSAPLLFGSTACDCVFHPSTEFRPLEISYWEALRAWWRIYWPAQLVSTVLLTLLTRLLVRSINQWRNEHPLEAALLEGSLQHVISVLTFAIGAVCLWLFAPRILGRGYRGFCLVVSGSSGDVSRLTAQQRMSLWFFIWWRQVAGGLFALLLAMPLNMVLGTMKINAGNEIAAAAGLFAIGPVIMKMLVGQPLKSFQIEARRPANETIPPDAAAQVSS
jgi:hypothetical protein